MFVGARRSLLSQPKVVAPSGGLNPAFSNVQFLYNGAGIDGAGVAGTSDVIGLTMSTGGGGSKTYSNTHAKFGSVSINASAVGQIYVADSAALSVAGNDFCWEAWWLYDTSVPSARRAIAGQYETPSAKRCWVIAYDGTDLEAFWSPNGVSNSSASRTTSMSADTFYHLVFSKEGTTGRFFLDGTQVGANITMDATLDDNDSPQNMIGGSLFTGSPGVFVGGLRYTVGEAIYTSDFTPPTAAFPES